jgi:ketosteroid isomerase-like protein
MHTSTRATNEELVREFLVSFAHLDVPALSQLVTDDLTWKVPGNLPISGIYDGKSGFIGDFLAGASTLFESGSLAFEINHLHTDGDVVVAEYVGTGKSASGKLYRNEYCVIFGFREGKISAVREYLDTAHVAEVLLSASPS